MAPISKDKKKKKTMKNYYNIDNNNNNNLQSPGWSTTVNWLLHTCTVTDETYVKEIWELILKYEYCRIPLINPPVIRPRL